MRVVVRYPTDVTVSPDSKYSVVSLNLPQGASACSLRTTSLVLFLYSVLVIWSHNQLFDVNKIEPIIRSAQGLHQSGVFRGLFLRVYFLTVLLLPRVQSGRLAGGNIMVWHCSSELPVKGVCLLSSLLSLLSSLGKVWCPD